MLFIHPSLMLITNLAAVYVLYLGGLRLRSTLLGRPSAFPWRRHVFLGTAVMVSG